MYYYYGEFMVLYNFKSLEYQKKTTRCFRGALYEKDME